MDARDGTGLQKVSVRLQDTGQSALTADDGTFELANVSAGDHELVVSAVNFILVRRTVTVTAGSVLDLTIPITEGTGTYTESVTVRGTAADRVDPAVAAQQTLGSNDLQQLRGLATNDPFRAIHALPGVANGDDLRSEFAVRGVAIDHMNFTFEGISTPLLVHTVQGIQDSGSVAMVNGDVLEEISLSSGSYPQRFGNRTGAQLDFRMREGSRDGTRGHVGVSMTDASAVAEGPLGETKKGSWLVSLRKSYLELLLRKIDPENDWGFGFSDVQSKLVYDLNARHQVQFAFTGGSSLLDQLPSQIGIDDVKDGKNAMGIGVMSWRFVPSPRVMLTQKLAATVNTFSNTNLQGLTINRGTSRDALYRADWSYLMSPRVTFQGGGEARRSSASRFDLGLSFTGREWQVREDVRETGFAASTYGTATVTQGRGILTPGVRVDHSTITGHTTVSPWLQTSHPMTPSLTLRGGGGIYRQEPTFAQLRGLRGASALRAERAYHLDAGVEGRWGASSKWQVTVYDREDRDLIRLPDAEIRLVNRLLVLPSLTSRYENALDGHSRGFELLLQRRSPNGLSGWVAYDLAFTRYHDRHTGEAFWGDFDQRHTLNLYGSYRFSDRMSFSTRLRAGSNFPTTGYWTARSDQYFLSDQRNLLRVPFYSRLDVRANRT